MFLVPGVEICLVNIGAIGELKAKVEPRIDRATAIMKQEVFTDAFICAL